jgi:hypothetical protein
MSEGARKPSTRVADRDEDNLVDALAPLGSSLTAGIGLNARAGAKQGRDRSARPAA